MVNNMGVDPNEWFENGPSEGEHLPENGEPQFSWEDTAPSEYEPPDEFVPSEFADLDWFRTDPKSKEETMHEKMYKIATAKYNPFAVGGSENLGGGSEQAQK